MEFSGTRPAECWTLSAHAAVQARL
jgi:hypothetical protein